MLLRLTNFIKTGVWFMIMARVVLISCVSKKLAHGAKAKELYISTLFKYNLKYAQTFNPERIFILSAKYGLVGLEQEIEPYNKTLNDMSAEEKKKWADEVAGQLEKIVDLQNDEFIFLAGESYRKYLLSRIAHYIIPMKGLGIGRQLKYLKEHAG
jgi:hypothetical protein